MASTEPRAISTEGDSPQLPNPEAHKPPTQTDASNPIELSEMSKSKHQEPSQTHPPASEEITTSRETPAITPAFVAPPIPKEPEEPVAPPLTRELTKPAIGPATDKPYPHPKESEIEGPVLYITLLLITGARHPFKLDRKYLQKRNVEVEGNNPVNMSLYKLKELILRDWREEWEAKPSSPESIRLISMGKLLTDKSKLSEFGFKEGASSTIVHMTIKPQEIVDEEEANKNTRDRDGSERSPRCRCMIM